MFKKASHNEQSRAQRAAEFGHVNEHGIDPEVFARTRDERERRRNDLVFAKKEIEMKNADLKRQIAAATARYKSGSIGALGYASFKALTDAYDRGRVQLLAIEKELSELKQQKQTAASQSHHAWIEQRHKKRLSFEYVFVEVAKENLAKNVWERLSTITIHRIGERYEEMEREEDKP
jgi:hypothetical protein